MSKSGGWFCVRNRLYPLLWPSTIEVSDRRVTAAPVIDAAEPGAAASPKVSAVTARSRWLGRAWGVWLGLFSLASFTLRPPPVRNVIDLDQYRDPGPKLAAALVLLALGAMVPALWGAATRGVDFRRSRFLAPVALLLCLSIPLSYIPPSDPLSIVYVVLVFNAMAAAIILASTDCDGEALFTALLASFAISHALLMAWVIKDHDYFWGRLFGRIQPNYWGEVAQAAVVAAFAMRGWIVRAGVVVVSLVIIYETQSRGSMVALAVGGGLAFILYTATSRWRVALWIGAALGLVLVGLFGSGFIAEDLLKVSDPLRGAGSGLTGRKAAWEETINLILNHPWLGVGYRQHEHYLTTEASAHNAYLATMADTGIFGFFAYILFLVGGLVRACVKSLSEPSGVNLACAAYLAAFMVDGLFERSALNTGNAYCQLMILCAAWAWRQDDPYGRPAWRGAPARAGR